MIGLLAAFPQRRTAASCQPPVPKPVLSFVMQTLPGPIPTFVASAPAFSSSRTPSGVPTLPAITKVPGSFFFNILNHFNDCVRMTMSNIDGDVFWNRSKRG